MEQKDKEKITIVIKDIVIALLAGALFLTLNEYTNISFYLKLTIIFLLIVLLILIWHLLVKKNAVAALKVLNKIRAFGVMDCYLYTYDEITESTESYLQSSDESFFAFLSYGSRVTSNMKLFEKMLNRIASTKGQVKLIVCNPDSILIDKVTKEQIEHTIGKLSKFKERIKVKFYPVTYSPVMRVLFINSDFLILSFYPEYKNKKVIQLKIKNQENSIYVPIKEYTDLIWENSTDIDWTKY
jgi:hypothetical protein